MLLHHRVFPCLPPPVLPHAPTRDTSTRQSSHWMSILKRFDCIATPLGWDATPSQGVPLPPFPNIFLGVSLRLPIQVSHFNYVKMKILFVTLSVDQLGEME